MISSKRRKTYLLFFISIIDAVSMSIILPILPVALSYYITIESNGGYLAGWISTIDAFSSGSNAYFNTVVLLGGIISSLFALTQALFANFLGALSDIYGRQKILITVSYVTVFNFLLWAVSHTLVLFILFRIICGAIAGKISAVSATFADLTSSSERSKGMGLINSAVGVGFIIGPLLGGLAYYVDLSHFSNNFTFAVFHPYSFSALLGASLSCVYLYLLSRFFKKTAFEINKSSSGESNVRSFSVQNMFLRKALSIHKISVKHIRNENIRYTLFTYFLFIGALISIGANYGYLAMERLNYGVESLTYMYFFIGSITVIFQAFILPYMIEFCGEKRLIIISIMITAFGLQVLSFCPDNHLPLFYFGLFLTTSSSCIANSSILGLASLSTGKHIQGEIMGIFRSSVAFARVFFPLIFNFIYFKYGSAFAYTSGAIYVFIVLIFAYQIKTEPNKAV